MFQFSGFAHLSMYYVFNIVGCPIQVSPDQFVCADPRRFSQLITPFFASESLGIPHTPLFCLLYFLEHWSLCATNLCAFYFVCFLSQYVNELCITVFIGVLCGASLKSSFEKPLKIH